MIIHNYLQTNFNYTDYQIAQIRYTVVSLLSEISKLILMGLFFAYTGHFLQYLVSVTVLSALRTCTGGLHFKHYTSCLAVSFVLIYLSVSQLPYIPMIRSLYFLCLLTCVLINYRYAPIVSCYRPTPSGVRIQKSKQQSFLIITAYALILFVLPITPYLITGFWIIMLQSLQLIIAKFIKKEERANETI